MKRVDKEEFLKEVRWQADSEERREQLERMVMLAKNEDRFFGFDPEFDQLVKNIQEHRLKMYEAKLKLAEHCAKRLEGR